MLPRIDGHAGLPVIRSTGIVDARALTSHESANAGLSFREAKDFELAEYLPAHYALSLSANASFRFPISAAIVRSCPFVFKSAT